MEGEGEGKKKRKDAPLGLRLLPCRCIVTCAFRWFSVPYALAQLGQLSCEKAPVSVSLSRPAINQITERSAIPNMWGKIKRGKGDAIRREAE